MYIYLYMYIHTYIYLYILYSLKRKHSAFEMLKGVKNNSK